MKQFKTVVHERAKNPESTDKFGKDVPVEVDDRVIVFGGVTGGQILAMIAMEGQSEQSRVATLVNFFFSVIKEQKDQAHLRSRLFDPHDEFGEEMISDIVIHLMEEWTGRPTQPSSDSSTTPVSTGESSTGNVPAEVLTPST